MTLKLLNLAVFIHNFFIFKDIIKNQLWCQ